MSRLMLTTAGESHGVAVTALLTGLPAGLVIDEEGIQSALTRRQGGYGRGGRMKIEKDRAVIEGGIRLGRTLGSPLLLRIGNKDVKIDTAPAVTRPRPGHADLAGMMKFGTKDARDVLERSSARETVARVAAGAVAAQLLEAFGITVCGFVRALGEVVAGEVPADPRELVAARDASPFFCPDPAVTEEMVRAVDAASQAGDTLGGVFEVQALGVPPGLGTNATFDARLDARLAGALMSIPAMKGVEIGLGFAAAALRGSAVHDPIVPDGKGHLIRSRNHAGGIEGGITNGQTVVVKTAMKPLSSLRKGLPSVDTATGEASTGAPERSDVTAVPAASVVGEAMVALVLADALLEKTGGDSMAEVKRNLAGYLHGVEGLFR